MNIRVLFLLIISCIFLEGCSSLFRTGYSSDEGPPVEYFHHTVQYSGETLSAISGWYTGSSIHWPVIHSHNPNLDIHRIYIGSTIRIPKHLLQNKKNLPETFIQQWNGTEQPRLIRTNNSPSHPKFDLRAISACKHLPSSTEGMHLCADLMSKSLGEKL